MFNKELLNDVAKWGLLLGVLMTISRILEYNMILSGDVVQVSLLIVEWPLAAAINFYILFRANKHRRSQLPLSVGYPMRLAINYSIMISIFAAVLVGIASHLYVLTEVGGYAQLMERTISSMRTILDGNDAISESVMDSYNEMLANAEATVNSDDGGQSRNLFSAILSMVSNYIIAGFVNGLIVGFFLKRKPQVADVINKEQDESSEKED